MTMMAPRVRHGVMRVGESFPRHDIGQSAPPVWPRIWGKVSPHFQTDWRRIGRIALITLAVIAALLSPTYVPALWGWQFKYTGADQFSFSLLAPQGGIPPLSIYWVKRTKDVTVGDTVSYGFIDRFVNGGEPKADEVTDPTIKQVLAVEPTRIKVHGLYLPTTAPVHWVPIDHVKGVVAEGPFSVVPKAYWRWYTLDYTLDANDMIERQRHLRHAFFGSPLSLAGRLRIASMSPRAVVFRNDGKYCVVQDITAEKFAITRSDGRMIAVRNGQLSGWQGREIEYLNADNGQRKWRFTPETLADRCLQQNKLQVMGIIVENTGQVDLLGDVVAKIKGRAVMVGDQKIKVVDARVVQFGIPHGVLTLATVRPALKVKAEMGTPFLVQP